jgi:ABC-2 type transport system ATP-binding protein
MERSAAINVSGVTKRFDGVTAVNDLSLQIQEGSVFGLLGPNGAGKTTTLRMILRITVPDEGHIEMLGEPLTEASQDRIGYLPEERGLYTRMKVREVLLFLAGLKGLDESEAARRVDEWLERLELAPRAGDKVIDLSKGMQQKVQFIAAVVHRPPVLILDEPFTGLDPVNAGIVKDIMLDLRKKGTTIILSTHRMEQVEMMCDSICLINKGQSVLAGDLASIKRSYGRNTVRIEYQGDGRFLDRPDLVAAANHFGAVTEIRLHPNADPQEILKAAVAQGVRLNHFELMEPPLNDIFIEKVAGVADA